jgi:hypothetical protein
MAVLCGLGVPRPSRRSRLRRARMAGHSARRGGPLLGPQRTQLPAVKSEDRRKEAPRECPPGLLQAAPTPPPPPREAAPSCSTVMELLIFS